MKFSKLFLLVCLLLLSVSTFSQNINKILEKPYKDWNMKEVAKILTDSQWTDQYQSAKGLAATSIQQNARGQNDTRVTGSDRGRSDSISQPSAIFIRLHSALPVRNALVRQRQLLMNYDKMNEEQKKEFDKSVDVLLNCPICENYYVVTVNKFKDTSLGVVSDGLFQTMNLEDLKGKIWLSNDKDERREIEAFTAPKNAEDLAVFFFKRNDEKGNPLLTTDNKEFKFVFSNELLDENNAYSALLPRNFEFKISKLIVDGKLAF